MRYLLNLEKIFTFSHEKQNSVVRIFSKRVMTIEDVMLGESTGVLTTNHHLH